MAYRLLPGPLYSPAHFARAPRRTAVEDAVADMGTGIVVDDAGRLVAFHESHLTTVERLAEVRS